METKLYELYEQKVDAQREEKAKCGRLSFLEPVTAGRALHGSGGRDQLVVATCQGLPKPDESWQVTTSEVGLIREMCYLLLQALLIVVLSLRF